jgi:hypothetical protein
MPISLAALGILCGIYCAFEQTCDRINLIKLAVILFISLNSTIRVIKSNYNADFFGNTHFFLDFLSSFAKVGTFATR